MMSPLTLQSSSSSHAPLPTSSSSSSSAAPGEATATSLSERTLFCAMRRFEIILLVGACLGAYAFLMISRNDYSGAPLVPPFANNRESIVTTGRTSSSMSYSYGCGAYGGRTEEQKNIPKSILLPRPLDLIRRGFPLEPIYNTVPKYDNLIQECSCLNPKADAACCQRNIRRAHKMGTIMTEHMFDFVNVKQYNRPYNNKYNDHFPTTDFRDVILIRNIYSSIVSGYLFHQEGNECDRTSSRGKFRHGEAYIKDWYHHLSYDPEHAHSGTFCEYLANEPEQIGLRSYIEWAFRYQYIGLLTHFGLAKEFPQIGERTKVICYEKLSSPEHDLESINEALDFWFNGTDHLEFKATLPGHVNYTGGHSTPHDPTLRTHLTDLIKQIDQEYYSNEIGWLDSILPC